MKYEVEKSVLIDLIECRDLVIRLYAAGVDDWEGCEFRGDSEIEDMKAHLSENFKGIAE
jgi:hypothetical protein